MRIVHLSDIHLSSSNYQEFKNSFENALINDLMAFNESKKIDVIVITGDLVDRGGHSLYDIVEYNDKEKYPSPYDIFEEVFITPIINALKFSKDNFLFIPGNHDVDESTILLKDEFELNKNIDNLSVNNYLKENVNLKHSNRIKEFKEFEFKFHAENNSYIFTNNQSTFIYNFDHNNSIGFLLINDSWRCSSIKLQNAKNKLFVGMQQFYDGMKSLQRSNTNINVLLIHHPTDNFFEKEEIEGFLTKNEIELMLFGHNHSEKPDIFYSAYGNCHNFRGKASLSNPEETDINYIPGYQIIDIDFIAYKIIEIHYRMYNNKASCKKFVYDNLIADNGIDKNRTNNFKGFNFYRENEKKVLKPEKDKNQFIS